MTIRDAIERAAAREYRKRWLAEAWKRTLAFERKTALLVSLLVAAVVVGTQALLDRVNVPVVLLSLVLGPAVVLVAVFVRALLHAPARLEWEASAPSHFEYRVLYEVGQETNEQGRAVRMPFLEFVTDRDAVLPVADPLWIGRPSALRFAKLPNAPLVRRGDPLPVYIVLSRWPWVRGRLVVRRFDTNGINILVEHSHGRTVRAELYYEEGNARPQFSRTG